MLNDDSDFFAQLSGASNLDASEMVTTIDVRVSKELSRLVIGGLKKDNVVLLKNISDWDAELLLQNVANHFFLGKQLQVQAAFASVHKHRSNIGKYFMSVNKRDNFQFIPPHSEGQKSVGMQLASFYCFENTTDGGETILFKADQSSPSWKMLKSLVTKIDLGGAVLSPAEKMAAKSLFQINLPEDLLQPGHKILREKQSPKPGIKIFEVLEDIEKHYSVILDKYVYTYWDNVGSIDYDSGSQFRIFLKQLNMLRTPNDGIDCEELDNAYSRRVWSSGVKLESIFSNKIVYKLCTNEMIIFNNLTWSHSCANWTPGSGKRNVAAAFA